MDASVAPDESTPGRSKVSLRQGISHDQQLLRDMAAINARVLQAMGPLAAGVLPAVPRRKPALHRPPFAPAYPETKRTMP